MIVGEFTQIVWAKTKRIGLTFRCEKNRYKVLAVYDPFGNTLENYTQNVKRPKSSGPATDRRTPELVYQTGHYNHLKQKNVISLSGFLANCFMYKI